MKRSNNSATCSSLYLLFAFFSDIVVAIFRDIMVALFRGIMAVGIVLLVAACEPAYRHEVDRLNDKAYEAHYRSIDSVEHYARQALQLSQQGYDDGHAEALSNLAFVSMVRMNYAQAERQLNEAVTLTDNQIEQFVAEVQLMRLCQRRSRNREFYEHRERAMSSLRRIDEERATLSERNQRRMIYGESELAIVNSTYYYYVGLERQASEALLQINEDEVRRDTAQYLNYLYNIGAGGIIIDGTPDDIADQEMENLYRCVAMAERCHYPYFEANAKEALAERLTDISQAESALHLFQHYGDVYQIAGAHRTLATCYHAMGNDREALHHLYQALSNKRINQAPDLVASIREQMSVAYAALNDKPQSDRNRNLYIDLQERTRQDRELEARAAMYDQTSMQLNMMIVAVVVAILLLLLALWLFSRQNKRQKQDNMLDELLSQRREEADEAWMRVERSERRQLEQRAKVSLVVSITPLIDRIIHEVKQLEKPIDTTMTEAQRQQQTAARSERLEYIKELTDQINQYNDVLTQWIQLRQGSLSLHIESFPLQPLFDIAAHGRTGFDMKQVTLDICATSAVVKADRVLTLFMLNTMADNARKFTPKGGRVCIEATEGDNYVEISVADTGQGMTPQTINHLFDAKPIIDQSTSQQQTIEQRSHGFGLVNCKGIIEKYRKISSIFSVCSLTVESRVGEGSRFAFRLPKGVRRIILALAMMTLGSQAQGATVDYRDMAHIYADSAYFSNVNGHYAQTIVFADSCMKYLNLQYLSQRSDRKLLMRLTNEHTAMPPEIAWLHDSVDVNYQVVLDIRNESAVAALALHDWQLYEHNNKAYTQLYKEMSADNTLADYCRMMQQSQANKRIAVILLILILLLIVPAYYMQYYRHRLNRQFRREKEQRQNIEMAEDERRRAELEDNNLHVANAVLDNCLSTLKHETMYYPNRIRQLTAEQDPKMLGEVVNYYRELYSILSEQAMRQVERFHLHLRAVDCFGHKVLGDEHALRVMWEVLAKDANQVEVAEKDGRYWLFTILQPQLHLTAEETASLFTPSSADHIPYLICRQVVRDHGEATNLRGCGIWAEAIDNKIYVKLTLPKYGKL